MSKRIQSLLLSAALLCAAILLTLLNTGCKPQRVHPGQLNSFDGAAYDSLTMAHGALEALRQPVAEEYPNLKNAYDRMATAYNVATVAYRAYRTTGGTDKLDASIALHDLAMALLLLETDILPSLQPRPVQAHFTVAYSPSELLDELQLAAAIASTFHGTQEETQAANVILQAARGALSAWSQTTGQSIDVETLTTIELI